eukprot:TRINITY_DN36728_c0_g3_i1.p1 TRINITY_DN36728_c0_g3~~TRINITY_DN36728_c0_g3_i1.p1  ORF type:complete len:348 (-),score=58.03 TRINITY_DN36728_c0_g3_i1:184-1173(-)
MGSLSRLDDTVGRGLASCSRLTIYWLVLSATCVDKACTEQASTVVANTTSLWPIHFAHMPLSSPRRDSLETAEFGHILRDIGRNGFDKYVQTVLPQELRLDPGFAKVFAESDHSRLNLAFRRWQARTFASYMGIPIRRISVQGEIIPKLEGIDYTWPELYDSAQYKKLIAWVRQLSKVYLKRTGFDEEEAKQKFLVFPWVEVYERGMAMRPMTRTDGAYIFSRYFASVTEGALKFNFEDPRGINPPYGKTASDGVYEGKISLVPSWVSTFLTPNMLNSTAVSYCFLIYPENGKLSFEDDKTADMKPMKQTQITDESVKRKQKAQRSSQR